MDAWTKASGGEGIEFLADGNGDFAKAIGLTMDGSGFGLGTRSQRYPWSWTTASCSRSTSRTRPRRREISGADNLLKDL